MENNNPFEKARQNTPEFIEECRKEIEGLNDSIREDEMEKEALVTYQSKLKEQMDAMAEKQGEDWDELLSEESSAGEKISLLVEKIQQSKGFIANVEHQML